MPNTRTAKRALRKSIAKHTVNLRNVHAYKNAMTEYVKAPSSDLLNKVFSKIDGAIKKGLLSLSRGSRLKSRLAKLLQK